jgi:hypothetical protein
MSVRLGEPTREGEAGPAAPGPEPSSALESGIVRKEDHEAEQEGGVPPWSVVNAYLCRGEHRAWVEGHAARSRAFADVIEALRNDRDERVEARRGVVLPFRR